MDTKEKKRQVSRRPKPSAVNTKPRREEKRPPRRQQPAQKNKPQKPTPEVVYTQPGPFNRNRFLLHMITVVAVVLAFVFGMSVFFKVDADKITVSGHNKYTPWDIRQASGLQGGEHLLSINEARIGGKIQDALPYVDEVRIGIKLPDTVNIEIVELDVVYAIQASDNSWWLIRSDGVVVEKTNKATAGEHTQIIGVTIDKPKSGEQAVATKEKKQEEEDAKPETVTNADRLSTAISLMQYLEEYGIIGDAASIDVSDMTQLEIWCGSRFQVLLGDTTQLKYKVKCMTLAINDEDMGDHASGILDVSFTTWPDEVGYTPF